MVEAAPTYLSHGLEQPDEVLALRVGQLGHLNVVVVVDGGGGCACGGRGWSVVGGRELLGWGAATQILHPSIRMHKAPHIHPSYIHTYHAGVDERQRGLPALHVDEDVARVQVRCCCSFCVLFLCILCWVGGRRPTGRKFYADLAIVIYMYTHKTNEQTKTKPKKSNARSVAYRASNYPPTAS